jgi:hypothetical protein
MIAEEEKRGATLSIRSSYIYSHEKRNRRKSFGCWYTKKKNME